MLQRRLPRRGEAGVRLGILKLAAIRAVPILRLFGALCAMVFCCNPAQAAPGSTNQSGVQLTIELRDGSRLVGKSLDDTLSFHSATLGDMKIPWSGIRSIEYAGGNGAEARLTATNGDGFAIQLAAETLRVEAGFGQIELPVKQIRSVKVTPRAKPNAAAGSDTAQLTIELRDGSHVIGRSLVDTVDFHSPAMGDLKLAWAGIRSIEYAGNNSEVARLTAANGDVYEVQFAVSSLGVETSFGKTELPVKLIRSITVLPAGSATLINVDFHGGGNTTKAGFAATGLTGTDYWNSYSDFPLGSVISSGVLTNLKFANGAVSSVGLAVTNAAGAWSKGASGPMYQGYLYPSDGGPRWGQHQLDGDQYERGFV